MKRLAAIILTAFVCAVSSYAQQESESSVPDSVKFVLDEFIDGKVYFDDGRPVASGKMNICNIDQTVYFKDKKGQIMQVAGNDHITKVFFGKDCFVHQYECYIRLMKEYDGVWLCCSKVMIIDDAQETAYGGKNYTNSIDSFGSLSDGRGNLFNLTPDMEYEIKWVPYFYDGSKMYLSTKGNINKLFPSRKEYFKKALKSSKINLNDYSQVRSLFEEMN